MCAKLNIFSLNEMHVLSYLEYLATNGVSAHKLANHISACKVKFTMFGLQFPLWDHPYGISLLLPRKISLIYPCYRKWSFSVRVCI